jgi:hypothetical protein
VNEAAQRAYETAAASAAAMVESLDISSAERTVAKMVYTTEPQEAVAMVDWMAVTSVHTTVERSAANSAAWKAAY